MINISKEIARPSSIVLPIGTVNVNIGEGILTYYPFGDIDVSKANEISYQIQDSTEFEYKPLNLTKNAITFNKNYTFSTTNSITFPPNTQIPSINSTENFYIGLNQDIEDERIDSVHIKRAVFSIVINKNDFNLSADNIQIHIRFSDKGVKMLNSGESNRINVKPTMFGSPIQFELTNFMFYAPDNSNYIPFTIEIESRTGSEPVFLNFDSRIIFEMRIEQVDFEVAYGYFSPAHFPTKTEQFEFNIEKFLPDGLFKLANPKIDVTLQSNIGTYLDYKMDYFKALNTNDPAYIPVYAWFNNHTTQSYNLSINAKPTIPGTFISRDFKTFDKDFGETFRLFENEKRSNTIEIKYTVGINSEFVKNDPSPSFVTFDPKFKYKFTMTVPFSLNEGSYYELNDSTSGGFDKIEINNENNFLNVDSVYLVLNISNGLPIKSTFRLKFVDFSGTEILTGLVRDYTIDAGKIDANGSVLTDNINNQIIKIKLTAEQFEQLRTVDKMYYKIRLEGRDIHSKIHFTPNDYIFIKTAVLLNFKVKTTL